MNLRICFQEDRGETFQDATRLFLCGIVFVILSMSVLAAVCQLAEIFVITNLKVVISDVDKGSDTPHLSERNAIGDLPVTFLKVREKWEGCSNPHW